TAATRSVATSWSICISIGPPQSLPRREVSATSTRPDTGPGDDAVRGILGLSPELQRREGLTNYCAVLDEEAPRWAGRFGRSILSALRRGPIRALAPGHLQTLMKVSARVSIAGRKPSVRRYLMKNVMEQAPNAESRIVLGSDRDQLGCVRVVL